MSSNEGVHEEDEEGYGAEIPSDDEAAMNSVNSQMPEEHTVKDLEMLQRRFEELEQEAEILTDFKWRNHLNSPRRWLRKRGGFRSIYVGNISRCRKIKMVLVTCPWCNTKQKISPGIMLIRCSQCQSNFRVPDSSLAPLVQHGLKKAVICGITYRNTKHELKGCINDAKCMKYLLVNKFRFPESSIIMLTDEERDPLRLPTKQNMRGALHWLVQGCRPGDSLVFHFAGHGSQKTDRSGDEVDGYNETIWPLDYKTQGVILDDEINSALVNPLPPGVKLHAVIDACHSGTALDLPFLCRMNRWGRYKWEDHRPASGAWKGTSGGEVFSFSGCDDHQKSQDTTALSKHETTGAMTYAFIQAIEHGQGSTYGTLLSSMRSIIRKADAVTKATDIISSLLNLMAPDIDFASAQEPQLTTNEPFDVYRKPFLL